MIGQDHGSIIAGPPDQIERDGTPVVAREFRAIADRWFCARKIDLPVCPGDQRCRVTPHTHRCSNLAATGLGIWNLAMAQTPKSAPVPPPRLCPTGIQGLDEVLRGR